MTRFTQPCFAVHMMVQAPAPSWFWDACRYILTLSALWSAYPNERLQQCKLLGSAQIATLLLQAAWVHSWWQCARCVRCAHNVTCCVSRHGTTGLCLACSKHDAKQFARGHKLQTLSGNGPHHDAPLLWHRGTPGSAMAESVNACRTRSVYQSDAI